MGNDVSQDKIQKIPKGYELIKILSYNVRLIFKSPLRSNQIGYFLTKVYDNIPNDIICLQGIYDVESRNIIIKIFKNEFPHIYVVPYKCNKKYNNIQEVNTDDCNTVGLLVLSKYKVINYYCKKFKENTENLPEHTGVICMNIDINNNIVSIYNTQLQADYKNIISNKKIRESQLEQLYECIKDNIKYIDSKPMYNEYNKTNINLILGNMNIEGKNMDNTNTTEEYENMITKFDYLDIYKLINKDQEHLFKNRNNYSLLYLLDNDENTEIKKYIDLSQLSDYTNDYTHDNKNYDKIFKQIYENYHINFIKASTIDVDFSEHYPMDLIMIIKT